MHIHALIAPERVACRQRATGKQQALELLSGLLARSVPDLSSAAILDGLLQRERQGSTGLGRGVAVPHGRLSGLREPTGAFIQLETAVDYDALDHRPVDLLFALLVPEEATDTHLQLLAQLAQMFSDKAFSQQLLDSRTDQALYQLLLHWEPPRATA